MSDLPTSDELGAIFARMSNLLLSEETVSSALQLITTLAAETLAEAVGAGITLVDARGLRTSAAATDVRVETADRLQYDLDEGPCLTAWAERRVVRLDDSDSDTRWPRWCQAAAALEVRSTLSAPMVTGDRALGAIKVYSHTPGVYTGHDEHLLSLFAAQAAILVANMQTYEAAQRLSESLREALRNRDVIGQAKGIMMERNGVDEDTAFAMLVQASQRGNIKLHEIARALAVSTSKRRS